MFVTEAGSASRYEMLASSVRLAASEVHSTDLMAATDDSLRERFVPHTEVGVKVPAPSRQKGVLTDAVPETASWLAAEQQDKYVITTKGRQLIDLQQPNVLHGGSCAQFTGVTEKPPIHIVAGGSSARPCRGGALAAALVHDRIQRLMFPETPLARCCNFALPGEWQAVPLTTGRMGFALYQPDQEQVQYTPYKGASVHLEHWIASAWAFTVPLPQPVAAASDGDEERAQQLLTARERGLAPRPYPVNAADSSAFDCELCDGSRALLYRGVKQVRGSERYTVSSSLLQLAMQDNTMQEGETFETPLEAALMVDSIVRSNQAHPSLRLVNFAASEAEVQYLPCTMSARSKVLQALRQRSKLIMADTSKLG